MLDYKGIEALFTVIELQSFEAAARKLFITQSAVSQRIRGLENYYGESVLVRTHPYRASDLGKHLIGHFKRISLLEDSLNEQINSSTTKTRISIALNRDVLECLFLDFIEGVDGLSDILLEIIADDQELTLDYLQQGLVSACLSTSKKGIAGGRTEFLGDMEYVLVASPEFAKRYFREGDPKKNLLEAPALKFDKHDALQDKYLETFFGLRRSGQSYHVIPSVQGFKRYALLGCGYGLIPKIDIEKELKQKKLVQLFKDKSWNVSLYWHYWTVESDTYKKFNESIIEYARGCLRHS